MQVSRNLRISSRYRAVTVFLIYGLSVRALDFRALAAPTRRRKCRASQTLAVSSGDDAAYCVSGCSDYQDLS